MRLAGMIGAEKNRGARHNCPVLFETVVFSFLEGVRSIERCHGKIHSSALQPYKKRPLTGDFATVEFALLHRNERASYASNRKSRSAIGIQLGSMLHEVQ